MHTKEVGRKLQRILPEEKTGFVPHGAYGLGTSPRFWKAVFVRVYGEAPQSDNDSRWDELFAIGYPLLRRLDGR